MIQNNIKHISRFIKDPRKFICELITPSDWKRMGNLSVHVALNDFRDVHRELPIIN